MRSFTESTDSSTEMHLVVNMWCRSPHHYCMESFNGLPRPIAHAFITWALVNKMSDSDVLMLRISRICLRIPSFWCLVRYCIVFNLSRILEKVCRNQKQEYVDKLSVELQKNNRERPLQTHNYLLPHYACYYWASQFSFICMRTFDIPITQDYAYHLPYNT